MMAVLIYCRMAPGAVVSGSRMVPAHHQQVSLYPTGCQQLQPPPAAARRKQVRGSMKPTLTHMAFSVYIGKCSQTRSSSHLVYASCVIVPELVCVCHVHLLSTFELCLTDVG